MMQAGKRSAFGGARTCLPDWGSRSVRMGHRCSWLAAAGSRNHRSHGVQYANFDGCDDRPEVQQLLGWRSRTMNPHWYPASSGSAVLLAVCQSRV